MKKIFLACIIWSASCIAAMAQQELVTVGHNEYRQSDSTASLASEILPADEFARLIAREKIQLIDVRAPQEYATGFIPGAKNMDVRDASFRNAVRKLDRKIPVALYCRSGARSRMAAKMLTGMGFKVYELEKGISSWKGKIEQLPENAD